MCITNTDDTNRGGELQTTEMVSLPQDVLDEARQVLLYNNSKYSVEDFIVKATKTAIKKFCLHDWKQTRFPDPDLDPDSDGERLKMEYELFNKVYDFGDFFADMLFEKGSPTYRYVKAMLESGEGEWVEKSIKPFALQDFTYNFFSYHVTDLEENHSGYFDSSNCVVCIDTNHRSNDATILHEMIHLHEFVLNQAPLYYQEIVLCCLYRRLSRKIRGFARELAKHGHSHRMETVNKLGGNHSMLFLMKSFDLDQRMGYSLGTVFGYKEKNNLP